MSTDKLNVGKTVAVVVVVAALLFIAYGELSNSLSGAIGYQKGLYKNCYDSDFTNDPEALGSVTVMKLNFQTNVYSPEEYHDQCLGQRRVKQWKCTTNNRPKAIDSYCEDTCSNGICV